MTELKDILVVEDDAFIALDLEDLLMSKGYNVLGPVPSVSEALNILEETTPDVALLDFNLGCETSTKIAKSLKTLGVPFIFLSGQVSRVILGDNEEEQTVLSKPYKPRRLISELEMACA